MLDVSFRTISKLLMYSRKQCNCRNFFPFWRKQIIFFRVGFSKQERFPSHFYWTMRKFLLQWKCRICLQRWRQSEKCKIVTEFGKCCPMSFFWDKFLERILEFLSKWGKFVAEEFKDAATSLTDIPQSI